MALTAPERETTVTVTEADDLVHIWTAIRRHIGRLRRHPAYTEVRSGRIDSTEWAEFTIPARDWNPASGARRKSGLSEEQRAAAAERLALARGAGESHA